MSTFPVWPQRTGGQIRATRLLTALVAAGSEVVVVSTRVDGPPGAQHRLIGPGFEEWCVRVSDDHHRAEAAMRLLTGDVSITDIAVATLWASTPELVDRLSVSLADADAIIHVQPYLAAAVAALRADLPSVCDEHNHELSLKSGLLPMNEGGRWLTAQVESVERIATTGAALVTATTDADLAAIRLDFDVPSSRTAVVPNGVDTSAIRFVVGSDRDVAGRTLRSNLGIEQARTALFVGSAHPPNADAARTIIEIARSHPELAFVLAGRHSDPLRRRRMPTNVHALGTVSEQQLDLLLAGADVALNPMGAGGGSNLKLITYLAAGIPTVSTPIGARGIATDDAGVTIAALDRFDDGIVAALRGGDRSARAGREYVVRNCDWRAISRRFASLVDERIPAR